MGILSGPWNWRRIKAFTALAVAFNKRQLRRLIFGRRDDGGERLFLENFAAEGMAPLSADHAAVVLELSRCVYCGTCEAVCPAPADRWPAWSRALEYSRFAARDLPPSCPPDCRLCEQHCPVGVPLRAIPAFVHRAGPGAPS